MSNSDDKKVNKTGDQKPSASKPAKPGRKRQASRPPTIDVEAVRLKTEKAEAIPAKDSTEKKPESAEKTPQAAAAKPRGDAPKVKSEAAGATGATRNSGPFGYRALALSAGTGAAASLVLLALTFGFSVFSSDTQDLEDRILALSGKVETLGSSQDNKNTEEAVAALRQQLAVLAESSSGAVLGKMGERIKTLEESISQSVSGSAELKSIAERLNQLDVRSAEAKSAFEKSVVRSALLEKAVKAAGEAIKGTTDGTQGSLVAQNLRLAGFEAQIKRLSENIENLQAKISKNATAAHFDKIVGVLQTDANTLAAKIFALDVVVAAATTKIDTRLASLEQIEKSDDSGRLAALSFAIEGLMRKIETGGSYERELNIVAAALPKNDQLEKLKAQAAAGVKSTAQLQRDFQPVLKSVLAADRPQTTSGMVGKLIGSAKSLIKVRRIGEIEGDSREAIIARLEARVKIGDLAAALVSVKKLQGASAQAAHAWAQAVEQRLRTVEQVKNLRNDIIANLGSKPMTSNAKSATKE